VERKNIKEEGKEGRWENQKKICFSSLTHTHSLSYIYMKVEVLTTIMG